MFTLGEHYFQENFTLCNVFKFMYFAIHFVYMLTILPWKFNNGCLSALQKISLKIVVSCPLMMDNYNRVKETYCEAKHSTQFLNELQRLNEVLGEL